MLLAASAIPARFHSTREDPVPLSGDPALATLDPETRHWKTTMFPTQLPTSRDEVMHLTRVLDCLLAEVDENRRAEGSSDSGQAKSGEYLSLQCLCLVHPNRGHLKGAFVCLWMLLIPRLHLSLHVLTVRPCSCGR